MSEQKIENLNEKFKDWVNRVVKNEKVSSRDFLKEGIALKEQALKITEQILPRNKKTGELDDPIIASVEKMIKVNEDVIRKKIVDLVYKGKIDPIDFYNVLKKLINDESRLFEFSSSIKNEAVKMGNTCELCVTCIACVNCVACGLCFFTGVAGAVAAGYLATSATSAAIAA